MAQALSFADVTCYWLLQNKKNVFNIALWRTNTYKAPPPQSRNYFTVAVASDLQDHVRSLDPHCTGNQLLPSQKTER